MLGTVLGPLLGSLHPVLYAATHFFPGAGSLGAYMMVPSLPCPPLCAGVHTQRGDHRQAGAGPLHPLELDLVLPGQVSDPSFLTPLGPQQLSPCPLCPGEVHQWAACLPLPSLAAVPVLGGGALWLAPRHLVAGAGVPKVAPQEGQAPAG